MKNPNEFYKQQLIRKGWKEPIAELGANTPVAIKQQKWMESFMKKTTDELLIDLDTKVDAMAWEDGVSLDMMIGFDLAFNIVKKHLK